MAARSKPATPAPDPAAEAPFLAQIRESPDDDQPRLIFADWLEERGDPRAPFIRTQCALASLPLDAPERDALEDLETKLLAAHGRAWVRTLPKLPGVTWGNIKLQHTGGWAIPEHPFERGLATGVVCQRATAWLKQAPELIRLGVQSLGLGMRAPNAAEVAVSPELSAIRTLAFVVGSEPGPVLTSPAIANVRRLLVDTWLPSLSELIECPALSRLEHLRLQRTTRQRRQPTPPEQWAALFRRLGSLRTLQTVGLATAGFEAALATPELGQLEHLTFWSLHRRAASRDGWGAAFRRPLFSHLQSLAFLFVEGVGQDFVSELMAHCSPRLTRLDLAAVKIGNPGAVALAQSPRLAQIKRLMLLGCNIGDAGVRALAKSPFVRGLTHLDLSGNKIGPRGCEALAKSETLTSLRKLELKGLDVGASRAALKRFSVQLSSASELKRQAELNKKWLK